MPNRCVVHGCNNISDMKAGICAHFSSTIKSKRGKCLRFVHTHRANLNPAERKVCGVFRPFSRAFFMEGCRQRLIPGSIPTIWEIEPGKQSSKRQNRKVSRV